MQVVATAGHVDHGKSTLVRELTGIEPDRYAEERRRGMTIDLGFAWTTLPSGADIAFVDVPGHERFVATMLAGVGPVPAIVMVVAADEGWMPQSEEHLAALDALGVRHGLLVVTKSDLADPDEAASRARERICRSSLGVVPVVAVSAATGRGMDLLRERLDGLVGGLPTPDPDAPVRLWVDRSFTITGAGTVVTGTLAAGLVSVGDELVVAPTGRTVTVRGVQSRQRPASAVGPVSRVALNLRGVGRDEVTRGMSLVTPQAWTLTAELDVNLTHPEELPREVVVHIGSASTPARVRPLGGLAVRLRLDTAVAVHVRDRLLLRNPGRRTVVGADVADVDPAPLTRRGDAGRRAAALAAPASVDAEVSRRGAVTSSRLRAAGWPDPPGAAVRVGEWWIDPAQLDRWRARLADSLAGTPEEPLSAGIPIEALRARIGLPDAAILRALLRDVAGWRITGGHVARPRHAAAGTDEPDALRELRRRLADDPFAAPDAARVAEVGARPLAHAVRTGGVLHLGHGVYVGVDAPELALATLAGLPQPFTTAEARQALGTSRRVVIPLLEHLDALRRTRRLDATGRRLVLQAEPVRARVDVAGVTPQEPDQGHPDLLGE